MSDRHGTKHLEEKLPLKENKFTGQKETRNQAKMGPEEKDSEARHGLRVALGPND